LLQDERISHAVVDVDGVPSALLNKEPMPTAQEESVQDDLPLLSTPDANNQSVLRREPAVSLENEDSPQTPDE